MKPAKIKSLEYQTTLKLIDQASKCDWCYPSWSHFYTLAEQHGVPCIVATVAMLVRCGYVVRCGDSIHLTVFGEQELSS